MRSVESSVGEAGQDLVGWILDHAVGGIGKWSSASDLADEYKRKPYRSDAERVQAVIRSAVAKNAATGFATGLGGVLTLPVAIPTSLAASLAIQARMVAAIAEIHGHDSKDDQVQTAILLCMLGTAMEDVVKQAGVTLGGKVAIEALKKVPGRVLIEINKRIGFRLVTKFGEKGVVNLAKLVPLVGGAVGGTFDGATCYMVGQAADRAFRPAATAERGADAVTWAKALDAYRYRVDLTGFPGAHEHRGWFDLKIDPGDVPRRLTSKLASGRKLRTIWRRGARSCSGSSTLAGRALRRRGLARSLAQALLPLISGRPVPTIFRIRISIRSEASEPSCSSNPSWQPQPRSPRSSAPRSSRWWTRRSRDGRASTEPLTAMPRSGVPISSVSPRCGGEPFSGKAIGRSSNRGSRGADSQRRSSLSVQSDDGAPETWRWRFSPRRGAAI